MAAGTDITHPVSVLEGAYKPPHLEPLPVCTIKENGGAVDNSESTLENNRKDREGASRPPRPIPVAGPLASTVRRCVSTTRLTSVLSQSDLVETELREEPAIKGMGQSEDEYMPVIRSGGCMDIGTRRNMEDTHVCIDDLARHARSQFIGGDVVSIRGGPGAFYGVFDGHGGKEAAKFVRDHLVRNFLEDVAFPRSLGEAVKNAFFKTDREFARACLVNEDWASGTTALTAMVFGSTLLVANAGDCRAVLSKRGKAVNMSRDHKPCCAVERSRIEAVGGFVDDGYLNGQLAVARALGDWHMVGLKDLNMDGPADGPLSAEPELQQATLTAEDEFLIIACDGLWDVFTSQNAVDFARKKLQQHNDPELCSKQLVAEALLRDTGDNLTVVTVCFSADAPPRLGGWTPRFRRSISAEGLRNLQECLNDSVP